MRPSAVYSSTLKAAPGNRGGLFFFLVLLVIVLAALPLTQKATEGM